MVLHNRGKRPLALPEFRRRAENVIRNRVRCWQLLGLAMGCYLGCILCLVSLAAESPSAQFGLAPPAPADQPLKALLVTGGCCHDYEAQHRILFEGIQARANVRVDVVFYRSNPTDPIGVTANLPMPIFRDPAWADGYDVVIHDECVALNDDPTSMRNTLAAHETIPAVHLHCAMHSFRGRGGAPATFTAKHHEAWCRHIGLMSVRHGPHLPVAVEFVDRSHPIVKGFSDWVTGNEELYNNEIMFTAQPLAVGRQTYQRNGQDVTDSAVVAWVNENAGVRSFSTSLGHFNHNVEDPRYLDMVTRGLLWACRKLDDDRYHQPYTGSNVLDIIEPVTAVGSASVIPVGTVTAIPVTVTAKSTQKSPAHPASDAIDGNTSTRWCGASPEMPNWLQLEWAEPISLSGAEIEWEIPDQWMQYPIETSADGVAWTRSFDASGNTEGGVRRDLFSAADVRFVRVNVLRQQRGKWPSLFEVRLFDAEAKKLQLAPVSEHDRPTAADSARFDAGGNIRPTYHRLSAADEETLLADVAVPEGFDVTLFAPWQMANYPTYLAAAPNGDLYVSSDGNGSLGRQPHRGRVLRLRDTDQDGRADQVTEFIRDIDSPRGILWDHDRLYVLHPPHIDVFYDTDQDGVAESSKRLISDIAFGFDKRSADHTTNGLEMGVDGWIYVACGDFGFMEATGSDGRTLQMRGGGVVRFRPDGTGLETFADGTRNIYGISISPTLDLFARDNTNDGGGWNVRFHHLSGLEDHGYPRLFRNFSEEIVPPLADYGGGSGCGACFLSEPGIPPFWNNGVYTCDWGREGSFRHPVHRQGAGFTENGEPARFFKMPRPTDIDVDGRSAIYQAAWKGPATFKWKGPDHGYIARAIPKGFTPSAVPDFATASDADLVALLRKSPSHVRRVAAQRMLLRRPLNPDTQRALLGVIADRSLPLANRVVALYAVSQRGLTSSTSLAIVDALVPAVAPDDPLLPLLIRACGDLGIDLRTAGQRGPLPADLLRRWLASTDPRATLEAIITATRQGAADVADGIAVQLGNSDGLIRHTATRGLATLGAVAATLQAFDRGSPAVQEGAALALMRMHQPEVVTAVRERLETVTEPSSRMLLINVLARLAQREARWEGDSWSTRPDTRGPYYQPVAWKETPRILATLNELLNDPDTSAAEAAAVAAALGRNRVRNDQGLTVLLNLAKTDAGLLATVIQQLAQQSELPAEAVPMLVAAARDAAAAPETLLGVIKLLLESTHPQAFPAVLDALATLQQHAAARPERDAARRLMLASPNLQNHAALLAERLTSDTEGPGGEWYAAGLLQIAQAKSSGAEPREVSLQAIEGAWQHAAGKRALLQAAFWTKLPTINERIRSATTDPDPRVQRLAKSTASRLGIQEPGHDTTAKIGGLPLLDAIAAVTRYADGSTPLGESIFTRAQCVTCHTVSEDQPAKGPYLGSIANIYRRPQLAEAILMPNKTIAQGFKTNLILLDAGTTLTGFVTQESADGLVLRDATGKEHRIAVEEIDERITLPTSVMPAGLINTFTVHEFASLLDYIESLGAKQKSGS